MPTCPTCGNSDELAMCSGCGCDIRTPSGVTFTGRPPEPQFNFGELFSQAAPTGYSCSGNCGSGTFITPFLCFRGSDIYEVQFPDGTTYTFEKQVDDSYKPVQGTTGATLTFNETSDKFELRVNGETWEFNDFDETNYEGYFEKLTMPGGQVFEVTYDSYGYTKIEGTWSEGGNQHGERYTFAYVTSGANEGEVESITHESKANGSWVNVSKVSYTYYLDSHRYGNEGDVWTMTLETYDGSSWVKTGFHYLAYYSDAKLKYSLDYRAYERLRAANSWSTPADVDENVEDTDFNGYANHKFQYDADDRVTTHVLDAGDRQYTLSYTQSENTDGENNWKYKVEETAPDNCKTIVYANYAQQVLVRELRDGNDKWIEYNKYDTNGRLIEQANPSAVQSYDDTEADLEVTLHSNAGLIRLYEYGSSTTATSSQAGDVEGYLKYEKIKKGSGGSAVTLREYQYIGDDQTGGPTVYPVAKAIDYRGATDKIETQYAYDWHSGTLQMEQRQTTLPAVSTSQNGSGIAATRTERFDKLGRLVWLKDERGAITHHEYHEHTGALVRTIEDVDTTKVSDEPSGWTTPSGFGLHLVTDYEVDDQGRTTQVLGPEHDVDGTTQRTASWTVYKDSAREVRTAQGYAVPIEGSSSSSSSGGEAESYDYVLVNPVSITKTDENGRTTESIQATRGSGVTDSGKLSASDTFARSSYVRWTTYQYSSTKGQLTSSRVYHTIPASGDGSEGTNYDQTDYGYDSMGRQNRVEAPGGTITRTVFDNHGRVASTWIGTDDTPTSGEWSPTNNTGANMTKATEHEYDSGNDEGDGNLTKTTEHVDSSTTRVTEYQYDWRNRQEYVIAPADASSRVTYTKSHYNDLDQVTKVERYHDSDNDIATAGPEPYDGDTPGDDTLLARTETSYDDRGRVYKTVVFDVGDEEGGSSSSSSSSAGGGNPMKKLTSNTWYDAAGNVIKQHPAGSERFQKTEYDGLGRQTKSYVGYDTSETASPTYAQADDVSGDTVFEQTETTYDDAGNVTKSVALRRLHDATGTGALSASTQPKARVTQVGYWYDGVGRQKATADYGTGTLNRDTQTSAPSRSDTILVTTTEYNADGEAYKSTDPAGTEARAEFDDAGRQTKQIQNYTDGNPATGGSDEDVTVETAYNADGLVSTLTAKNSTTGDQVTTNVYGTDVGGITPEIYRKDLLRAVIYPDSDDPSDLSGNGSDGDYDRVEYKYNRQGEIIELKDQTETVHQYSYDKLGRQTEDKVSSLGTGVDGGVRRIERTYNVRGLLEKVTSYDAASGGNVVNELQREYNDLGLLTTEYQEHKGAKDANTLYVEYNYDDTADGNNEYTKGLRLKSVRYPNGRLVHYTYGSGDGDKLNRLDAIKDDNSGDPGDTLSQYTYVGLGMIVIEDYPEPEVKLDLFDGTSGTYAGLDRFDRVIDQKWYDSGASEDRDRYKYGYDRAGNRTYRENTLTSAKDELYAYDGMYQLVNFDRGDLNAQKTDLTGTRIREEDFTLDPTGNWTDYVQKTSGSTDLDQDRTHNDVNETTDITETTGPAWVTPVHDRAGNMTTAPNPSSLTTALTCTYDAWNRLVEADPTGLLTFKHEYDGLNRRTARKVEAGATEAYQYFYYNASWQRLEMRPDVTTGDPPEQLQPYCQHVWSARYIDAPVLWDRDADNDSETGDLGKSGSGLEERLYYLGDANFNVTTLVDTSGEAVEHYQYDPYGRVKVLNGGTPDTDGDEWTDDPNNGTDVANVILYTGREYDSIICLYQYRHRYYHAEVGRFLSRDPIGYWNEANLYVYCKSHPSSALDAFGESCRYKEGSKRLITDGEFATYDAQVEGTPFAHLAGHYADDVRQQYRRKLTALNVTFQPRRIGTGLVSGPAIQRGPIPPHAWAVAYFLFFQTVDVCEDKPGDCMVQVKEQWKRERWTESSGTWTDVTSANLRQDHDALRRHVPPRYPTVGTTTIVKRTRPDGIYTDQIIAVDIPHIESFLRDIPGSQDQEFNKMTIKQLFILRDTSNFGSVVQAWGCTFTLGFNEKGQGVASMK